VKDPRASKKLARESELRSECSLRVRCVWQGSGCGCDSSGCGCAGGADSLMKLNPFWISFGKTASLVFVGIM
jgi:hypothetical protein